MHSFDIPDIRWVERFVVGSSHPENWLTPREVDMQLEKVNRALRIGKLIGIEQNFTILTDSKKELLTQYTVYHIGFKHRPDGR